MVYCPIILKKPSRAEVFDSEAQTRGASVGRRGISYVELLIVLAFIGSMAVFLLVTLKPAVQLAKARDSRRKSDLQKLKTPLEDYYNDNNCYPPASLLNCDPGTLLQPYWSKVPCDPLTSLSYYYERPNCDTYRIYVKLDYPQDPDIAKVGCSNGCGPGGSYDFGVSSPNTSLTESGGVGPGDGGGCQGTLTACQGSVCNSVPADSPAVPKYCDDPCCGGQCCGPAGCPVVCP